MNRIQNLVALFILATLVSPVAAQTWSVNAGTSTVFLQGEVEAFHDPLPSFDMDTQMDASFQTPFVDLNGDPFDIGENISASATAPGVQLDYHTKADAGGYVKATLGSSFDLQWRSAVSLELRGDTPRYSARGDSDLTSHIEAELSGLNPGTLYKVFYEWSLFASAIEDHENFSEDPEFGSTELDFSFGTLAFNNIGVNAGPSAGFMATDSTAGSGVLFLNAGTTAVSLVVDLIGTATASLNEPPIMTAFGSVDSARPEAFGRLTLRVEAIVPEPASVVLGLLAIVGLALVGARKR